jgi:PAS domain-containing protein
MLRKESSLHDNALFDAVLSFFAFEQPTSRAAEVARRQISDRRREGSRKLATATHFVVAILGILTLATAILSLFDLTSLRLRDVSWNGQGEHAPTIIVLLLGIEIALIAAIAVQDHLRKRMAGLLEDSERRIALAAEAADLGLWRWDADTDSFWATPHCRDMFGIPPNTEYDMATMSDAVHPDDRASVTNSIQKALQDETTFEVEYRLSLGDGRSHWCGRAAGPPKGRTAELRRSPEPWRTSPSR